MKLLNAIQQKLIAPKNQYNAFGKYKYRSCEDILEAIKPLLGNGTLTLTDEIVLVGDRYYVKAMAQIRDGDKTRTVSAFARESLDKKGMDSAQITGAASSYARKYALNGLFCIDDSKDADHNNIGDSSPKAVPKKPTAKQNKVLDKICEILQKKTENIVVKSKVAALFLSAAGKYPSKPEFAKEAAEWLISLDRENEWTEKPKKAPELAEEPHGTFVVDVLTSPMEAETTADPPNGTQKEDGPPALTQKNTKFMTKIKNLLIEQAVHSHLLFEERDFTKEEKMKLKDVVWIVLNHWPSSQDDVLLCMKAIKPKDVIDE